MDHCLSPQDSAIIPPVAGRDDPSAYQNVRRQPSLEAAELLQRHPHVGSWIESMQSMEAFGDVQMQTPVPWEPPSLQPYQILPLNTNPTCPVDVLWLDFIASCSSTASNLGNKQAEVEPSRRSNYPSINNLLNSSENVVQNPLGDLLANILNTYCSPSPFPEQVAVLYKMYMILRWQAVPTEENYNLLPHWLRPTTAQIVTPHPAWIDQSAWPRARDLLITAQDIYTFDKYSVVHTGKLSVNWPHNPADVLITQDDHRQGMRGKKQVIINPVFEQHIRDLRNWSIDPKVAEIFPELYECYKP